MRLASLLLLSAATRASASIISPAASLDSSLPDKQFRKELIFSTGFLLPINPAFISILNFMGILAVSAYDELVPPHTYTIPTYPEVQILTNTWTEARFLLWGIYLTVMDMVKYVRFHDVLIKLFWNDDLVGQIIVRTAQELRLPGTTRNDTWVDIHDSGKLRLANMSRDIIPSSKERPKAPLVSNSTRSNSTDILPPETPIDKSLPALSIPPKPPPQLLPNPPLLPSISINFARVPGAKRLERNDVFLTFYTAILHVAEFPVQMDMVAFDSNLPTAGMNVSMINAGIGCLNRQAIAALMYVPQYMMAHSGFGYKETIFKVELSGKVACRGRVKLDAGL